MNQRRIIAVVVVLHNKVVLSIGYQTYRPCGSIQQVLLNLDRWCVDEILILSISRSRCRLGPDESLLKQVNQLGLSTPIIYGGGIRSVHDALYVVSEGADRVVLDSVLHTNPNLLPDVASAIGKQAIIASLPLEIVNGVLCHINYITRDSLPLTDSPSLHYLSSASEILLVDYHGEGTRTPTITPSCIPEIFSRELIFFGGLSTSKSAQIFFYDQRFSAIAFGYHLNTHELSYHSLKSSLMHFPFIRPSPFHPTHND